MTMQLKDTEQFDLRPYSSVLTFENVGELPSMFNFTHVTIAHIGSMKQKKVFA